MIRDFVPRPVWIGDNDVQVGTQERKVVVAAVPHDDVAGRHGNGSHVHDMFVRDVAVGEDDLVGAQPADKLSELLFRVNVNPGWIQRACEDGRVQPSLQVGNLRGGKGDYLVLGAPAKVDVEVMKIAAAGAEDDHPGAGPRPSTAGDPADVPRAARTSSDLRHRRHRTASLPTGIPAHHFFASTTKPLNLSLRGAKPRGNLLFRGDRFAALAMTNQTTVLLPGPARRACAHPRNGPCSTLRPAMRSPRRWPYWTHAGSAGRRRRCLRATRLVRTS